MSACLHVCALLGLGLLAGSCARVPPVQHITAVDVRAGTLPAYPPRVDWLRPAFDLNMGLPEGGK
jgi:hypothetical protein